MIQAIIQARLGGATRFGEPKIMKKINGLTLLEIMYRRLEYSSFIDLITIAVPVNEIELYDFCKNKGWNVSLGSEENVLSRFVNAIQGNIILRLTADCPLICPDIIDKMIIEHIKGDYDYTSNNFFNEETMFDGQDTEIIKNKILFNLNEFLPDNSIDRQHVTSYIRENKDKYNCKVYKNDIDYSFLRLTIDYQEDFEVVKKVINELGFYCIADDIYNLYKTKPEIFEINKKFSRNSSYFEQKNKEK